MYHLRVPSLYVALCIFTHSSVVPFLLNFSFQKQKFVSVQLSVKRFCCWGLYLSTVQPNSSGSSAAVQTVLELLAVLLWKSSPKCFSNSLAFQVGTASTCVCTWGWILADVKTEQKQQIHKPRKIGLLNCLPWERFSVIYGKNQRAVCVPFKMGWGEIIIIAFCWIFVAWAAVQPRRWLVDAVLGLACVCRAWAHLDSAFHDYSVLKCHDAVILIFWSFSLSF